jgi:hypothetical protein
MEHDDGPADRSFLLTHLSQSGVTDDIGVVTLAPRRRSAAWAAAQRFVVLAIVAGFIAGFLVAGATHNKSDHTSAPGIAVGIAVGAVLLGLLLWRAMSMRLVIDRLHKTLTIRNLLRTETVTASEMADIEEDEEVINRGRYSVTRVPCLCVEPRGRGRIWIQASLRNGDDESIAKALAAFCRENGVRCLVTPGDASSS